MLQDAFRKQNTTFKSTLSVLIDIIDSTVISPLNASNKFTLSNTSALNNTIETISYLKNEEKKKRPKPNSNPKHVQLCRSSPCQL